VRALPHASPPPQNTPRSRTPGSPPAPASAAPGHAPTTTPRAGHAFTHRTDRCREPPSLRPGTDTPLESRRPDALPASPSPSQKTRTAKSEQPQGPPPPDTSTAPLPQDHPGTLTQPLHRTDMVSVGQTRQIRSDQTPPHNRRPARGRTYTRPPAG
jgi:hypothetical protein